MEVGRAQRAAGMRAFLGTTRAAGGTHGRPSGSGDSDLGPKASRTQFRRAGEGECIIRSPGAKESFYLRRPVLEGSLCVQR